MKQMYSRICVLAIAVFSLSAIQISAQVSASITSSSPVLCNGGNDGSATAAPSGGTGPFTYAWAPGGGTNATANNLSAGSYSCTITDQFDMSTATATVTITEPFAITTSMSSVQSSCGNPNGSATVVASGGSPAYSYLWSPGNQTSATAIGLSAGSYTVTVTDVNACFQTATVNVTNVPGPTATISSFINTSCYGGNNGSATVIASGGSAPYLYSWSPTGGTGATANNLVAGCYTVMVTDANFCTAFATVCITQPGAINLNITSNNVSCFGNCDGSATCTIVSGGTPPFSYSWSPTGGPGATASGLCANTYTCSVTDMNGCFSQNSFAITQPPLLNQTYSSSNGCTPCTGTATVTPTGGTTPYAFTWSPNVSTTNSASSLCSGAYTVTTTDNHGCSRTSTITISNSTALSVTTSWNNAECNTPIGSLYCTPSGGSAPYTYSWTPGNYTTQNVNGVMPGTYTIVVTDACMNTATATVTVYNNPGPAPVIVSSTNPTCANTCNGMIQGSSSGGTGPYTYMWSPAFQTMPTATNLCPGTYTLTVTDAVGCSGTTTAILTANNVVNVSVTTNNSGCTACTGTANATATGGQGPLTYSWSNSATTQFINNLCVGNYTVTVTDSIGCTGTGIGSVGANTGFNATVSSTPAACWYTTGTGTVTMSGGLPPYTYLWTPTNQTTSTATNLPPGVYHIIVGDQSGCFASVFDTIQAPPAINSYVTNQSVNCGATAGMAIVHASGGVPPLSYQWSNSVANDTMTTLVGGNYTCTITDAHGCQNTAYTSLFSTCDDIVMGNVYTDPNLNCVFDAGDSHAQWTYVYATPGNYTTWTDANGNYVLHLPFTGTYTIHCNPYYGWMVGCPVSTTYTATFTNLGDTLYNYNFGMHPSPVQNIGVWLTSTAARPGFPMDYTISYYNNGTIAVNNVVLTFNHDPILSFVSASTAPTSYNNPTAVWNLGTLPAGAWSSITVHMNVPANAVLGNSLCANANIMPLAGESNTWDNYATDCRIIQGSFDPNEKSASAFSLDPVAGTIDQDDSLITYTIHFQNTGTDTAFNIVVIDTLSSNLDPLSIEPGPSSHVYTPELCNGVMKFNFYNIQLPDSNRNEPMSHGWFQYRAKMKQGLIPGDVINNTAGIYFDYNAPVITNTTSDTVIVNVTTGITEFHNDNFSLYPNPAKESVTIVLPASSAGKNSDLLLTDATGRIITQKTFSEQTTTIDLSSVASGIYFCTLRSDGKIIGVQKLIKE
ncbi:MAG TPA: T9SS type A sorting domain-containing protein [Bacteroidia bacterium]|jgi:hypothetical protein|nr:T9SS type A sorting domain-containing protein [Bacteroidia bacterium]